MVDICARVCYNLYVKFAFFDIECASVHKNTAKICAFGYVLCDENFNILEREDILINPRGKFELTDRKGEKGLVLPYEYDEFKKYPVFPQVYTRIRELLQSDGTMVIGHAVLNDVKYLNLETKRFKLPSFDFRFTDSQLIYMAHSGDFTHQCGLEHIAAALNVEFTPHRAVDDAYATMRIVQAMCSEHGCGYVQLIKQLGVGAGRIKDYNIYRPQSTGLRAYNAARSAEKKARSQARIRFFDNVSRKKLKKTGKLRGTTVTFSKQLEDKTDVSIPLVDKIYSLGGRYSARLRECTYYVCAENDTCQRTADAHKSDRLKVFELPEFLEFLDE